MSRSRAPEPDLIGWLVSRNGVAQRKSRQRINGRRRVMLVDAGHRTSKTTATLFRNLATARWAIAGTEAVVKAEMLFPKESKEIRWTLLRMKVESED